MLLHETVAGALRSRAERAPDAVAFRFLGDGEAETALITYGELDAKVSAIALALRAAIGPARSGREATRSPGGVGARAVLLYPPGIEFLAAFLGCLRAGVVAVPAYLPVSRRLQDRLGPIFQSANPDLILTSGELDVRRLANVRAEHEPPPCLRTDELGPEPGFVPSAPLADDVAFLQYTSGSTGSPKGVMVTHGNLVANARALAPAFGMSERSVFVNWLPLYHDMGLMGLGLQTVFLGATCILMPPASFLQKPARWLSALSRFRGTHSAAPNFAYRLCVDKISEAESKDFDLGAWECAANGAEPIRADVIDGFVSRFSACGFRRTTMQPCYGLAEATLLVSATRCAEARERDSERGEGASPAAVSCGGWGFTSGASVAVVDPERLVPVAAGEVGEIWVSGPQVARGYYGDAEASERTFGATLGDGSGPYLRTGDLGVVRDGELIVTGRLKDLIIVHGQNHYPQDLEATADASHAALMRGHAAAFAVTIDGEERLVLALEVRREAVRRLDAEEVTRAVAIAIAQRHEIPVHRVLLLKPGGLPRTSSGKVQRAACRAAFLEETLPLVASPAQAGDERPARETSNGARAVASVLRASLGRVLERPARHLDPDVAFAELGLTSVQAAELAMLLGSALGRVLSPTIFFEHPTMAQLARHLTDEQGEPAEARPAASAPAQEPVAIVGMACRFPGAHDLDEFFDLLCAGRDAVGPAPDDRLPRMASRQRLVVGGFLGEVFGFDAAYFGISAAEAAAMDPQHRLLLEVTQHALDDAGIPAATLRGSETGVFVGFSTSEHAALFQRRGMPVTSHTATGCFGGVAAGRISYLYDLRGPSYTVDAVCSSALLAVHLACQSLRDGECEQAVVGGVVLMLSDAGQAWFESLGVTSAGGDRCRAFDARADGIVLGEGVASLVLKPLSRALADGDRVYALLRGSSTVQDGRSNGLTAPTERSQRAMLERALNRAGIAPHEVAYVDAHGTGTVLGDPIEARALGAVYGRGRGAEQPLRIGSVKSNLGHCSVVGGLASLIKVALAIHRGALPKSLHFTSPNPHIDFESLGLAVQTETTPWPAGPRTAGVTALSFGGTNVHVLLSEAPPRRAPALCGAAGPHLLVLSAKTDEALARRALAFARLAERADVSWPGVTYTAARRRTHHERRVALLFDEPSQLGALLRDVRAGGAGSRVLSAVADPRLLEAARRYVEGDERALIELFAGREEVCSLPPYPFDERTFAPPLPSSSPSATGSERSIETRAQPRRGDLAALVRRELAETLQIEEELILDDTSLADLGHNSLAALEMSEKLRELGAGEVALDRLIAARTFAELTASLSEPSDRGARQAVDWRAEATLPSDIAQGFARAPGAGLAQAVLLTGATGFLGAFLLHELLRRSDRPIVCLVRAKDDDDGRERIAENLERYGLWNERAFGRVSPLVGDLSQPRFGLSKDRFARLAEGVAEVFHNGALVTYALPYRDLAAANVAGTIEVLRLGARARHKPIHFVSTMGLTFPPRATTLTEDIDLGDEPEHPLGYVQSKWVCEKLIASARARGLCVSVYRPAWIGGASGTGSCNTQDFLYQFTRGIVELGAAPDVSHPLDIVPVDFMARAIVTLAGDAGSHGTDFNLVHPAPGSLKDWVGELRAAGHAIELEPMDRWKARLRDACPRDNPLFPLRALFLDPVPGLGRTVYEYYLPDGLCVGQTNARTLERLAQAGGDFAELGDLEITEPLVRHLTQSGFLRAQGANRCDASDATGAPRKPADVRV